MKIEERLTTISEITGLPMLKAHKESCGEDSCADSCEIFGEGQNPCEGCPVQAGLTKLHRYEVTGLSPAEVEELQEKQMPKPPERKVDPELPHLGKVHYCSCGVMFPNWHDGVSTNYCGNCGQRLK